MFHCIEFHVAALVDLKTSPGNWLEQLLILQGTGLQAQVKPYVVETDQGPVEVADLFFADGTATRGLPFAFFSFVDSLIPLIGHSYQSKKRHSIGRI
jgi:hypothetical protein